MTDFRALCAELTEKLDDLNCSYNIPSQSALVERARDALAEPEPKGPTDEKLTQLVFESFRGSIEFLCDAEEEAHLMIRSHVKFARAVLARWGRPTPQPVPVSERLPGPEDCDAEGRCWLMGPKFSTWDLNYPPKTTSSTMWAYWLPARALPVPTSENANCGRGA